MTRLRRYSNCNLHWYSPRFGHDNHRYYDPPPRSLRTRLYIVEGTQGTDPRKYGRDRQGDLFAWMWPDCGWNWLAHRPAIRSTPLARLFDALHEHVHTPHGRTP